MEDLDLKCLVPRKRVNVMLVGNHSAGKSSFINWYIEESIQKTGVAIETSGFTIVHSGKKKDSWKGEASIEYFEWLDGVDKLDGGSVTPNIRTEICASKARQFSSVNFIDTPGLTDGQMEYPYPVDQVIMFFSDHCDLVLVFFDPIGQALCERTMGVVEKLNDQCADKVSYYCSKADTLDDAKDRQKVLIQITQNLSGRIKNPHTFDIPTIYLPNDDVDSEAIPNNIEEMCELIDQTISAAVQHSLNNLRTDCETVVAKMAEAEEKDAAANASNSSRRLIKLALVVIVLLFALVVPLAIALHKLESVFQVLTTLKGPGRGSWGAKVARPLIALAELSPLWFHDAQGKPSTTEELKGLGVAVAVFIGYYLISTVIFTYLYPAKEVLPSQKLRHYKLYKQRCEALLVKRRAWYKEYQVRVCSTPLGLLPELIRRLTMGAVLSTGDCDQQRVTSAR